MNAPEIITGDGASLAIYRDAPSLNGLRTAALGQFQCETAEDGARLVRVAMERLRSEGFGAALGPMDGNTWGKHRLVIESDGRPPFLMEPSNPVHCVGAFEASGLAVVSRYVSAIRSSDIAPSGSAAPQGLRLRNFDPGRAEEELTRIHTLSLQAFADNHFYQPICLEEFVAGYRPVLGLVDPELVLLAEDKTGALRGFLFALPNLTEGQKPRSVVLKTYASRMKGAGSMMANAFHERAKAKGFGEVIHALMHDSNLSAQHSGNTGGKVFRRYALWGGRL